jgi:hypothetical protein
LEACCSLAVMAAADGDVDLTTDDRLDARLFAVIVVRDGAKEISMVGYGESRHFVFRGSPGHLPDVASPVEKTVFTVAVEMDEFGCGHNATPACGGASAMRWVIKEAKPTGAL